MAELVFCMIECALISGGLSLEACSKNVLQYKAFNARVVTYIANIDWLMWRFFNQKLHCKIICFTYFHLQLSPVPLLDRWLQALQLIPTWPRMSPGHLGIMPPLAAQAVAEQRYHKGISVRFWWHIMVVWGHDVRHFSCTGLILMQNPQGHLENECSIIWCYRYAICFKHWSFLSNTAFEHLYNYFFKVLTISLFFRESSMNTWPTRISPTQSLKHSRYFFRMANISHLKSARHAARSSCDGRYLSTGMARIDSGLGVSIGRCKLVILSRTA